MITIKRLANLCCSIYGYPGFEKPAWNHLDPGTEDDVCWGLLQLPEGDVIVFRGSYVFKDWVHDLLVWKTPFDRPALDISLYPLAPTLHYGFAKGLAKMWSEARPMLRPRTPLYLTGHSLGAGRASQILYMANVDGIPVAGNARFGEPGCATLATAALIGGLPGAQNSFRNAGKSWWDFDKVTVSTYPVRLDQPVPLIPVDAPPDGDAIARLGIWARHHMPLYAAVAPDVPADRVYLMET